MSGECSFPKVYHGKGPGTPALWKSDLVASLQGMDPEGITWAYSERYDWFGTGNSGKERVPQAWIDATIAAKEQGQLPPPAAHAPSLKTEDGAAKREVYWYLGDYSTAYVIENKAFVDGSHSAVISGVLHCCGGPSVLANGTLAVLAAEHQLWRALTEPEVAKKLKPVMLPLSPDTWAVQSGTAVKVVPALVALVVELGIDGFIADYEPHANTTTAHAEAFTKFLTALASGLHAKGKQLGVCVSDWGVIGPLHYKLLSTCKADLWVSMGSTYYGKDVKDPTRGGEIDKLHVAQMVSVFPLDSIAVGIGTVAPQGACSAAPGLMTGQYGWTQTSLEAFLAWVSSQGISKLGIWRADIAALLYKQPHYCGVEPWMLAQFQSFLSNTTGA